MHGVKSLATVLMNLAGKNVATSVDTRGNAPRNVTQQASSGNAEMFAHSRTGPASAVTSPLAGTVQNTAAWNRETPAHMITLTVMVMLSTPFAAKASQCQGQRLVTEDVPRTVAPTQLILRVL